MIGTTNIVNYKGANGKDFFFEKQMENKFEYNDMVIMKNPNAKNPTSGLKLSTNWEAH